MGLCARRNLTRKTTLARDRANELVTLAQRSGDGDQLLEAYHFRWSTALFRGDVAATLDDARIGVETYDMARHRHLRQTSAATIRECARTFAAPSRCNIRRAGTRKGIRRDGDRSGRSTGHSISVVLRVHQPRYLPIQAIAKGVYAAAHRARQWRENLGLMPLRAASLLLHGMGHVRRCWQRQRYELLTLK